MNLIIFDIDGTLIRNNELATVAYGKTVDQLYGIKSYNTNWDDYEYMTDIGILREIYFKYFEKKLTWKEILEFEQRYFENFRMLSNSLNIESIIFPGIHRLLRRIESSKEWKYAIYTGGFKRIANQKLELIDIDPFITPVAYAQDGLDRANIFYVAFERAKLIYNIKLFDKIILVGDSKSDMKVARFYSIPMIGVGGTLSSEQLLTEGVKSVFLDYLDIEVFFRTITSI